MFARSARLPNMCTVLWLLRRIQYGFRRTVSFFKWWEIWRKHAIGVGIGVIVVFVVRFGAVLCLSVAFVRFVVHVHAWYTHRDADDSLHNAVWVATLLFQFFLFVLLERTRSAIVDELAAVVSGDVLVYIFLFFRLRPGRCVVQTLYGCRVSLFLLASIWVPVASPSWGCMMMWRSSGIRPFLLICRFPSHASVRCLFGVTAGWMPLLAFSQSRLPSLSLCLLNILFPHVID